MLRELVICLAFAFLPSGALAQEVKLKFAVISAEKDSMWQTVLKPFVEAVNRDGAGIVQIEAFLSGALGRSVPAQAQMVLDGVADMAIIIPGANPGRFADHSLLEMPGLFRGVVEGSLAYWNLVNEGTLRGYDRYRVLVTMTAPQFNLHSRRPLQRLSDLKGMKLRTASEADRAILIALGAVPVALPVNEGAEAIARGTVDGAEMNTIPLIDYGYDRVTKYSYYLDLARAGLAVVMNKQKFDELPAAAKAIIEKYSGEWLINQSVKNVETLNEELTAKLKSEPGRVSTMPSSADQKIADAAIASVIDTWVGRDPTFPATFAKIRASAEKVRASTRK